MTLFTKRPAPYELQKSLDRDQAQYPADQSDEYHQEQAPQPQEAIFRPARKEFVVDVMDGWERP
jgi:hypothetical protein